MYRSPKKIRRSIDVFLDDMRNIALQDAVISDDEQRILDIIEHEFTHLQNQLIQVLESGLEDEEFGELLRDMLHDIIVNATEVAKADGVVTSDENALLSRLRQFTLGEDS